jgi:hypothetical protein
VGNRLLPPQETRRARRQRPLPVLVVLGRQGLSMRAPPCKHAWRVKIDLFLDIPLALMHKLSKRALRSRHVRVDGVNWPKAYTYCGKCGARKTL